MSLMPVFPVWLVILLLFLGLGLVLLQYVLIRGKLGSSRALGISLLRCFSFFLLISFALNPLFVSKKEHRVSPTLAVLIDTSQSMGLPGALGKGSRLEEARSLLLEPQGLLKRLKERYEVKVYALGESLRTLEEEELSRLGAGEKNANLSGALEKLSSEDPQVLLFSDGNLQWENKGSKVSSPLVVSMGNPEGYRDVLIKSVKAPSMAFRGREVTIDVTLKGYGYRGLTLPVVLKDGNRLLTGKSIRFNENSSEAALVFSFTPQEIGQHSLSVSVLPQAGESLASNNTVNFSLKVVRDKMRVLMVSGSPSMNYRFIRMALKSDPSIDLLSFVILRTPSDVLNVPLQEQSLIPFPVETLFSKELTEFDLLIFDNFPYHFYFHPNYLGAIKEFVKGGGGFALMGGPHLFGRYGGTVIEEILPVRLPGKEDYRRDFPTGVKVSRTGNSHPILRWSADDGQGMNHPATVWEEMPELDGFNVLEPKNSGAVLLESADRESWPILVVGSYGKGRILVLGTDYSWKWYSGMVAKGRGNRAYLKFVEKMVRWLTKDPSLDPVEITLSERRGTAGEEKEVRIRAKEGSGISLSVFDGAGIKIRSQLKTTGQTGEYLGSFLPEKGGIHKVRVGTLGGQWEESIAIAGPMENLDGAPDHEKLRTISASSGGKVLEKGDDLLSEIEDHARKKESRFVEEKRLPLWSMPLALVLIVTLLGTEWYLRRRWGLV
jgi:uncharacterized membrane protein